MNERRYIAISIKHTIYSQHGFVLWGRHRTADDEDRTFSGYAFGKDQCELYSLADFQKKYGHGVIKCDEAVPMLPMREMCKRHKKWDTVLVDEVEFLLATRPKAEV